MANALGTLFSDIADAIRGKTGDTGTMKPAEFPTAIERIVSGGDSVVVGGTKFQTYISYLSASAVGGKCRPRIIYNLDNDAIAIFIFRTGRRTEIANDTNYYFVSAYGLDSRYFNPANETFGLCRVCYSYGSVGFTTYGLANKGLEDPINTNGLSFTSTEEETATKADITLGSATNSSGVTYRYFEVGVPDSTTWIFDDKVTYTVVAIGFANDE